MGPVQRAPVSRAPSSLASSVGSVGSLDDLFGTSAPTPSVPVAHSSADTAGSLLNFDNHQPAAPAPSHHQHQPAQSVAHNDFFGMTAPVPTPAPAPISAGVQSAPTSGGYTGNPNNTYSSQPHIGQHQQQRQQQQQQQHFNSFSSGQSQQNQSAFGGLGTPWKP